MRRLHAPAALALLLATACGGGGGDAGPTYTVSGTVTAAGAGAAVTLGGLSAVAGPTGAWSIPGVASGTYTVTPTKAGVIFTPASRNITVGSADLTGVDFTASLTFDLSGTIRSAGGQRVAVDTRDPNTSGGNNDAPATAQAVPSAVTVGGWASASLDTYDYYRVTLAAGQVVTLVIAEADPLANDLDLFLFGAADTTTPAATSEGTGSTEAVTVPAGGDYYVMVGALGGASNYVLTIGAAPAAAAAAVDALRSDREFVPGEVLVRFKESALTISASGDSLQARAAALGLRPLGGAARGSHALLG
ncbi:MAG: PPC domain-containing protein, partial [Anaeromyxobacteraceae bacterium]|nr:PPC domain-containing protein [Anaeromyxobacteraceae bacterium]